MRIHTIFLPGTLFILALSASCASPSGDLVSAIKNTGFECENPTSARELDEDGTLWRIACGDARAYLASFEEDGRICVSPIDVGGPAIWVEPETPLREIERKFQWPLQGTSGLQVLRWSDPTTLLQGKFIDYGGTQVQRLGNAGVVYYPDGFHLHIGDF